MIDLMKGMILEATRISTITACKNAAKGIGSYPTEESLRKQWAENKNSLEVILVEDEFIKFIMDIVNEYKSEVVNGV